MFSRRLNLLEFWTNTLRFFILLKSKTKLNFVNDTKQYNELKKAIEHAIMNDELKEFIDDVSEKKSSEANNANKSWHDDKKDHKSDSCFSKLKVINLIEDVRLPSSRKKSQENHGDDPLVVTMTIDQCIVKCILVDTRSSVNVLSKSTFNQIRIPWDRVLPYATLLVGFASQTTKSDGKMSLLVSVQDTANMVKFLIMSVPSLDNSIMGRSSLNQFQA